MTTSAHEQLRARLARELPAERIVTDPLRRLAWGTDSHRSAKDLASMGSTKWAAMPVTLPPGRARLPVPRDIC